MRKVLSLVLGTALVLSSFSMAFASNLSDIADSPNEQAIEVVNSLEIVEGNPDGTFQPDKDVTRAEFAAMVTRALGIPESALAGFTSTKFNDTTGYGWAVPYLAYCESRGILVGDGMGNVMPGRTVTANEAVTMVLRAIGYTNNSAALVGVWPANYVTMAQDLGLYDDVATDVNINKGNAAQMIFNALTVDKVQVDADGTTEFIVTGSGNNETRVNMLTDGLDCEEEEYQVVSGDEDGMINMYEYAGQFGTIFRSNDTDEIVAFAPDCDVITGTLDLDGIADNNSTTAVWSNDTEFETIDGDDYNLPSVAEYVYDDDGNERFSAVFKNTEELGDSDDLGSGINDMDDKYVTMYVDLSGKTVDEIYSIVAWDVENDAMVEASDLDDIEEDQSLLGSDFALDDNDEEIDLNSFALIGVSELGDISEDDVVYVFENDDQEIVRVEVGTETAVGNVKNFTPVSSSDDTGYEFDIDSETYYNASLNVYGSLSNAENVTDAEVADEITAYLDANGLVYDFENDTRGTDNFAFVKASGSGVRDEVSLVLSDGTSEVFDVDDDMNNIENALMADDHSIIKYGLNSGGDISSVDETIINADNTADYLVVTNGANDIEFTSNSVVKGTFAAEAGTFTKDSLAIDKDVVVFTFEHDGANAADQNWATADDYDVTTIDRVNKDELLTDDIMLLLDQEDNDRVVAIMMSDDDCEGGDDDDVYAVFDAVYNTSNDDGDRVQRLEGFGNGESIDYLTDGEDMVEEDDVAYYDTFAPVVYKLVLDDGVVTNAEEFTTVAGLANIDDETTLAVMTVDAADDNRSIESGGVLYGIDDDAVIYEVRDDDTYRKSNDDFEVGDEVKLFYVDDDEAADIVVFKRV